MCRYVARWREGNAPASPRDGYLELEWAPGTEQVDFGNLRFRIALPKSAKMHSAIAEGSKKVSLPECFKKNRKKIFGNDINAQVDWV